MKERAAAQWRLSWTDYKTVRQYQTMGDLLDELRDYGYDAGDGNNDAALPAGDGRVRERRNGHYWLTREPKP